MLDTLFVKTRAEKIRKKWIKAAGIRAVKTVAQTAAATIGTTAMLDEVNWSMISLESNRGVLVLT